VEICVSGNQTEDALLDLSLAAFSEIERVERLLSFHDEHSELTRINRSAHLTECEISEDLDMVLRCSLSLSKLTGGRYDLSVASDLVKLELLPDSGGTSEAEGNWSDLEINDRRLRFRKPMQLDLGGIAKGYAVDRAIEILAGECTAVVNAGGDLRITDWEGQTVGVKVPGKDSVSGVVELSMQGPAIATSGAYYRDGKQAIVFPETGQPVHDQRSISVFAPTCMLADALTKVAFLCPNCQAVLEAMHSHAVVVDQLGSVKNL